MSKYRQAYAPEFRQQLAELVHAGRSVNNVAKEFGLHCWRRLNIDHLGCGGNLGLLGGSSCIHMKTEFEQSNSI